MSDYAGDEGYYSDEINRGTFSRFVDRIPMQLV